MGREEIRGYFISYNERKVNAMFMTKRRKNELHYTRLFTSYLKRDIKLFKTELEYGQPSLFTAERVFWDLIVIRDRLKLDVYEAVKVMCYEELESVSDFLHRPIP